MLKERGKWQIWTVALISTATVSSIASLLMTIMIARSKNSSRSRQEVVDATRVDNARMKNACILSSSPYHRIIFGMSLSDTLSSLALTLGPFAVPLNTPQAIWGIGNHHTCTVDGLMLTLGAVSTFFMHCF